VNLTLGKLQDGRPPLHSHTQADIHVRTHTGIHTRTQSHTGIHARIHARTHAHPRRHPGTHAHADIHARTQTNICAEVHHLHLSRIVRIRKVY